MASPFFMLFVLLLFSWYPSMQSYVHFDEMSADEESEMELAISELQRALYDPRNMMTEASFCSFTQLPLSEDEGGIIHWIISTLAEKNVFSLAFEKKHLERKGKLIEHVHPLRFISHICSSAKLNHALREIEKSTFKWAGFMQGFSRRMIQEHARNNLFAYIPSFADYMGVSQERVAALCQEKDWDALAKYLCHHTQTR